jgi:GT2 family glycosyltransferase
MQKLKRLLRVLPLLVASPLLVLFAFVGIAAADLLWLVLGRKRGSDPRPADKLRAASIVIPNWNGRELLEKYLPSVVAAASKNPGNEVLVVDNGSTDGSAEFLRVNFPPVKVLALKQNLGFGGGSNAGFRAAKNDIVVLLNNDMRVEPDFLEPLLEGFTDEDVFAVSCQIFFSDPSRQREETGLTQGWWEGGLLRVRHRIDDAVTGLYPCFYGGGGSSAFRRRHFFELGGFDELLSPFYLEDTDLGFLAWKRGWKVLYQPRSKVIHEHRGTIGRRFSPDKIQTVLKKNHILFCWKNIHEWRRLGPHFLFILGDALMSEAFGDSVERVSLQGIWHAFLQLPQALRSRWSARRLAVVSDSETFLRPLGGYFRDRFGAPHRAPEAEKGRKPRVLFVSPYPICPPVHGGGVFMYYTVRELARHCEVHLIVLLDRPQERADHAELERVCGSAEFLVRMEGRPRAFGAMAPHAVREFANADLEWLIQRQIYARQIELVQLEYTALGQYAGDFRHIATALFEHDVYFQSVARALREARGGLWRIVAGIEYLRALRYELRMLPKLDHIQTCSRENREYLQSFLPRLAGKIEEGLRAGIDTTEYEFRAQRREPWTMLFLGSFRHTPNRSALEWFTRNVLPRVLERRPEARLVVVGSEPPPRHSLPGTDAVELRGFVEDIREPLARYAVFVCPILSGSGVRVKLLEAFAAGIPVVSTRLGAEGLAREDGEFCLLADDPAEFAGRIVSLFDDPGRALQMAARARDEVVKNWDSAVITARLVESYRTALRKKQPGGGRGAPECAAVTSSRPRA